MWDDDVVLCSDRSVLWVNKSEEETSDFNKDNNPPFSCSLLLSRQSFASHISYLSDQQEGMQL